MLDLNKLVCMVSMNSLLDIHHMCILFRHAVEMASSTLVAASPALLLACVSRGLMIKKSNIFKWCNACRMADADSRLNGSVDKKKWSDCSASEKTQVDDGSSHSQSGLLVEVAAGR